MSECGCIYVGGYDAPSYYKSASVRPCKTGRWCVECGHEIKPLEKHEHVVGKWDGLTDEHNTCSDCLNARDVFFCEGWEFGSIWERIAEHVLEMSGEIGSECLVELTPRNRAWVCEMIEDYWRDYADDEDDDEEVVS